VVAGGEADDDEDGGVGVGGKDDEDDGVAWPQRWRGR
jgi:hypothetical protein